MSPQDIADAVLKQPPETPDRFAKLARLVVTKERLRAVVYFLPDALKTPIWDGTEKMVN